MNQVLFARETPLARDLAAYIAAGIRDVGLHRDKLAAAGWDASLAEVAAGDLDVHFLIHRAMFDLAVPESWPSDSERLIETLDAAAALGATGVYGTTGGAGGLSWEAAADAFAEAIGPAAVHARHMDLSLMVETTNPLFAHINIAHTLRDTVDLTAMAGIDICLDIYAFWAERNLRAVLSEAVPRTRLVQVSDWMPGTEQLDRAAPGTGGIPLQQLLGWIVEDGYTGVYDLELRGHDGDVEVALAGIAWVSAVLSSLGHRDASTGGAR